MLHNTGNLTLQKVVVVQKVIKCMYESMYITLKFDTGEKLDRATCKEIQKLYGWYDITNFP